MFKRLFIFFVFLISLLFFTKDVLGVDIVTSDVDVFDLEVVSMKVPDVNSGDPVRLLLSVKNTSNTAIALDRVNVEIMDLSEKHIESLFDTNLSKIDPLTTRQVQAEYDSNLKKGQYIVDATAIFMGKEIFTKKMIFKVNAKPVKVMEDKREVEVGEQIQAFVFGRRLGILLMSLGLLLIVLVLVFYYKTGKETDSSFEKKITRKLKEFKPITWAIIGLYMFLVAFGFYLYLSSSGPEQSIIINNQIGVTGTN